MDCTVHGVAKSQTRLSDFHLILPVTKKSRNISEKKNHFRIKTQKTDREVSITLGNYT